MCGRRFALLGRLLALRVVLEEVLELGLIRTWIRDSAWSWDGDPVKVGYDVSTRAEAAFQVSLELVL